MNSTLLIPFTTSSNSQSCSFKQKSLTIFLDTHLRRTILLEIFSKKTNNPNIAIGRSWIFGNFEYSKKIETFKWTLFSQIYIENFLLYTCRSIQSWYLLKKKNPCNKLVKIYEKVKIKYISNTNDECFKRLAFAIRIKNNLSFIKIEHHRYRI